MRNINTLLALPATLFAVVAAHAQELPWPHNLPRTAKYYPSDAAHVKRELAAQERLAWHAPVGVKKMGEDEGEKFWMGYWDLREHFDSSPEDRPSEEEPTKNATIIPALLPAIAPHLERYTDFNYGHIRRMIFERDFQCPGGTYSCSSIGHDDLCCNSGDTCVSTYSGVGCCPSGASCGSDVSSCDTEAGYTSCPNSPNGGCCIPGAACEGTGCVVYGTQTITRTLNTATATTGASWTTETSSGRTITIAYPTTELSVTTKTVTLSPSGDATTRTVTFSGESCQAGFFSCAATLGGGCCPTGQGCANDGTCPVQTTATAGAPVLPTSQSVSPQDVASSTSTTTVPANCPTGFYMCSAVYLGGCCRVGRDCQTTSCPPQDTTTIVNNPTVAVTGGGGVGGAAAGGSCANGWFGCGAGGNGGCCPSGYQCGVQSCSATLPGQRDTAKMAPSGAGALRWAWGFMGFGVVVGVGMVWL